MTEKVFLRIVSDYLLEYDGDFFNMHKPSDIRVLVYILNRDNGFSEQECMQTSKFTSANMGKEVQRIRFDLENNDIASAIDRCNRLDKLLFE